MKRFYNTLLAGCLFLVIAIALIVPPAAFAGENPQQCDIQKASCIARTSDGASIEFDVLPKPVLAMIESTFVVMVTSNGKPVPDAQVRLDLSMPHMFMGKNQPVMKHVKDGRYEGKGIITRCASGRKTWQADVTLGSNGKTAHASFVFEVK
jgi:hypothetical protein